MLNQKGLTVDILDRTGRRRFATLPVGPRPHEGAVSLDGAYAYIALYGDGLYGKNPRPNSRIAVVDIAAAQVVGEIDLSPYSAPHGIAVGPDGLLWVTLEDQETIGIVDPRRRELVGTVATPGARAHWIVLSRDGSTAYTSNKQAPFLSVIDTAMRRETNRILLPRGAQGLALSPDGQRLFVADFSEPVLHAIDLNTNDRREIRLQTSPATARPAVTLDGRRVLVTSADAGTVEIVDVEAGRSSVVIKVGESPLAVTVAPEGDVAYAANYGERSISVIDLATSQLRSTIEVGEAPEIVLYAEAQVRALQSR